MKYAYDQSEFPPAPDLQIQLSLPDAAPQTPLLPALVDTGADFSIVGLSHLDSIGAQQIRTRRVRGLWGGQRRVDEFAVDIHIEGRVYPAIQVLADADSDDIILGRNLLNKLILLLHGPNQTTEILERVR